MPRSEMMTCTLPVDKVDVRIYKYIYVCICICICIYTCVYIYAYMYICIYIFAYIHIHVSYKYIGCGVSRRARLPLIKLPPRRHAHQSPRPLPPPYHTRNIRGPPRVRPPFARFPDGSSATAWSRNENFECSAGVTGS